MKLKSGLNELFIEPMKNYFAQRDVWVIAGPTASGKSAVAVQLALKISGEIVCADSMQIYKEMNIGTAKTTSSQMNGISHHMMDVISPDESFSVANYVESAIRVIHEIIARGNVPILCGGTGQYISALTKGIDYIPVQTDACLRSELEKEYQQLGADAFYKRLLSVDPDLEGRIHPNDKKRMIRAVEMIRLTGQTKTHLDQQSRNRAPRYRYGLFCINHDREVLYRRIENRVDEMMSMGFLDEVSQLYLKYPILSSTASQAIGYKELLLHIRGELSLYDAITKIKQSTRNYAKRQLTWFRKEDEFIWIHNKNTEEATDQILHEIYHIQ